MQQLSARVPLSAAGPTLSRTVAGVWKWGQWGWKLQAQETLSLIESCLEAGVSTFDHADIYGGYTSEGDFGKALALKPALRSQMEIVTKCGICMVSDQRPQYKHKSYDTSREHIIRSAENSLQALQTDYIDVLLIHRPSPLMDPAEIAEAFSTLRQQGKVRYFGVSNFSPSQFDMLSSFTELVTNQIQISVLHRSPMLDGSLDHSLAAGYRPMAWSPLGSGRIFTDLEAEDVQRVRAVAEDLRAKYGMPGLDQLLLAWLMRHPSGILPVLGTARAERVRDAVAAEQIELSRADWFRLWEAAAGEEVP